MTSLFNFQTYCLVLCFPTQVSFWHKSVIKIINYTYCLECVMVRPKGQYNIFKNSLIMIVFGFMS